jgi:DNA-binding transcriptional ArsR family regulator
MSLSTEKRTEILQLLADGKITAGEAAELLSPSPAAEAQSPTPPPAPEALKQTEAENGRKPQWLHIQVSDMSTGKSRVKVNIPLRMVKFGLNMGRRFAPEMEGVNWDDLSRVVTEEEGVLVDVQDDEDGEHVRIYVD